MLRIDNKNAGLTPCILAALLKGGALVDVNLMKHSFMILFSGYIKKILVNN